MLIVILITYQVIIDLKLILLLKKLLYLSPLTIQIIQDFILLFYTLYIDLSENLEFTLIYFKNLLLNIYHLHYR